MRRYVINKVLILAVTLFMTLGCSRGGAIEIGQEAPDFTFKDLSGKASSLSEFKGKVIILDFFATWCQPCRQEIPHFIELQNSYGPKGFSVIGMSLVDLNTTKGFADKFGISYPVGIDDGTASGIYGPVRSIPMTFVIGKDFKVFKIYIGYRPKEVFENDVKELLK